MLTLPQRSPRNYQIYELHKLPVYNGPIESRFDLKSKFMAIYGQDNFQIKLYEECIEENGQYHCSAEHQIQGNEVTCIIGIWNSEGISSSCPSKNNI